MTPGYAKKQEQPLREGRNSALQTFAPVNCCDYSFISPGPREPEQSTLK